MGRQLWAVGKDSASSQMNPRWWTGFLRPLRWTLGSGQGLSTLSDGLSYWVLPVAHSHVDKVSVIFFYISDMPTCSADHITYLLSQTLTVN